MIHIACRLRRLFNQPLIRKSGVSRSFFTDKVLCYNQDRKGAEAGGAKGLYR